MRKFEVAKIYCYKVNTFLMEVSLQMTLGYTHLLSHEIAEPIRSLEIQ